MKVNYNLPNGTEITKGVTTIAELEEAGRDADCGAVIMSMNGYTYSLCTEEETAPIGESIVAVTYIAGDGSLCTTEVHNLTQLLSVLDVVREAHADTLTISGAFFNSLA